MNENNTNKVILCGFYALIAYLALSLIVKYLVWGLVGLVAWQLIQCRKK